MSRNSHRALPLLVVVFLVQVPAQAQVWEVGSFSATRVEYDRALKSREKRSKVNMSKVGIREEEQDSKKPADAQFTVVINFKAGKTWFLVPRRKVYVESPPADTPGVTVSDEPGTVLAPTPCEGYTLAEKRKPARHAERSVEEWRCYSNATGDVVQLYDPELRVVVRSEGAKGHVVELRNIQVGNQPNALFELPPGYRKGTMREIMTGVTDLPGYKDQGDAGSQKK